MSSMPCGVGWSVGRSTFLQFEDQAKAHAPGSSAGFESIIAEVFDVDRYARALD
jgi:hypothetical protein